jgi:hypothetical protein
MCFVWISEQISIISLYSINWLAFITETECVYCAVRTESWIQINCRLQFVNHVQLKSRCWPWYYCRTRKYPVSRHNYVSFSSKGYTESSRHFSIYTAHVTAPFLINGSHFLTSQIRSFCTDHASFPLRWLSLCLSSVCLQLLRQWTPPVNHSQTQWTSSVFSHVFGHKHSTLDTHYLVTNL